MSSMHWAQRFIALWDIAFLCKIYSEKAKKKYIFEWEKILA